MSTASASKTKGTTKYSPIGDALIMAMSIIPAARQIYSPFKTPSQVSRTGPKEVMAAGAYMQQALNSITKNNYEFIVSDTYTASYEKLQRAIRAAARENK